MSLSKIVQIKFSQLMWCEADLACNMCLRQSKSTKAHQSIHGLDFSFHFNIFFFIRLLAFTMNSVKDLNRSALNLYRKRKQFHEHEMWNSIAFMEMPTKNIRLAIQQRQKQNIQSMIFFLPQLTKSLGVCKRKLLQPNIHILIKHCYGYEDLMSCFMANISLLTGIGLFYVSLAFIFFGILLLLFFFSPFVCCFFSRALTQTIGYPKYCMRKQCIRKQ